MTGLGRSDDVFVRHTGQLRNPFVFLGCSDVRKKSVVSTDAGLDAEVEPVSKWVFFRASHCAGVDVGCDTGLDGDVSLADQFNQFGVVEKCRAVTDSLYFQSLDCTPNLLRRPSFSSVDGSTQIQHFGSLEGFRVVLKSPLI